MNMASMDDKSTLEDDVLYAHFDSNSIRFSLSDSDSDSDYGFDSKVTVAVTN